jgi:hypothetical protein
MGILLYYFLKFYTNPDNSITWILYREATKVWFPVEKVIILLARTFILYVNKFSEELYYLHLGHTIA